MFIIYQPLLLSVNLTKYHIEETPIMPEKELWLTHSMKETISFVAFSADSVKCAELKMKKTAITGIDVQLIKVVSL